MVNLLPSPMLYFSNASQDPIGYCQGTDPAAARYLAMSYNALSNVISAMKQAGPNILPQQLNSSNSLQHVPWRDSPLTRWLQSRLQPAHEVLVVGTVLSGPEVRMWFAFHKTHLGSVMTMGTCSMQTTKLAALACSNIPCLKVMCMLHSGCC